MRLGSQGTSSREISLHTEIINSLSGQGGMGITPRAVWDSRCTHTPCDKEHKTAQELQRKQEDLAKQTPEHYSRALPKSENTHHCTRTG